MTQDRAQASGFISGLRKAPVTTNSDQPQSGDPAMRKLSFFVTILPIFVSAPLFAVTTVIVGTGSGDYTTLQAAVNALPSNGGEVEIMAGTYKGQTTITKPNVWLIGEGSSASSTVLADNLSAAGTGSDEKSSTLIVTTTATGFFARNLSIENTYGTGSQAVALFLQADEAVLRNVNITGNQDTLYLGSLGCSGSTCNAARQYFYDSYIQGDIDFIFGDGAAVFDSCTMEITENGSLSGETTVTAQYRQFTNYLSGFVFWNSTIRSSPATGMTADYLGRPWSKLAYVVSINSTLTAAINKAGWIEWEPGTTNYLSTAYFGEYDSTGVGAIGYTDKERESHAVYLTSSQASAYAPDTFLAGSNAWSPTSVTH
jgi:pectin methylesterase-like acyl-CoA thioesterase